MVSTISIYFQLHLSEFWTKKKRRNVNEGATVRKRLLRVEGVAGGVVGGGSYWQAAI